MRAFAKGKKMGTIGIVKRTGRGLSALALALAATQLVACAGGGRMSDYDLGMATAVEDEAPLGGEALAQRRMDLDRAWRDLQHFADRILVPADATSREDAGVGDGQTDND